MADGFGTAANAVVSNAVSGSVSITITANTHTVIVAVTVNSNQPVSSVTDSGGNGYTNVGSINNGAGIRTEMWRSTNVKVTLNATSVTVMFGGVKVTGVICVGTWTGVLGFGLSNTAAPANTSAPSISVNPCQAALSWAVAALGVTGGGTLSANTGNLRTSNSTGSKSADVGLGLNDRPGDGASGGVLNMRSPELQNIISTTVAGTGACVAIELRPTTTIIKLESVVDVAGTGTPITTPSFATTLGDEITVLVAQDNNANTVTNVTDTVGSVYQKITGIATGIGGEIEVWAATSAATNSANAVTVTAGPFNQAIIVTAIDWTGVASRGNNATNSANSTSPSLTISTQDADNAIVSLIGVFGGSTPLQTAGDEREFNVATLPKSTPESSFVQDNDSHTAASLTNSATLSVAKQWQMAGYELRTVKAAVAVPTRTLLGVGM